MSNYNNNKRNNILLFLKKKGRSVLTGEIALELGISITESIEHLNYLSDTTLVKLESELPESWILSK